MKMQLRDDCRTAEDVEARRIAVLRKRNASYKKPKSRTVIEIVAADCPIKIPVVIPAPIIPFRKIKLSSPITAQFINAPNLSPPRKQWPSIERIVCAVSDFYNVSLEELLSRRMERRASFPRQIIYYLATRMTLLSMPQIAEYLANRNHTTILYGVRKIERRAARDERLRDELELLQMKIREATP